MMRRRQRDDTGASALEFALVLPILLVLMFGIIDFGAYFAQTLSLNNAARQLARAAVVEGQDCAAEKDKALADAAATIAITGEIQLDMTGGSCPAPCKGLPSGADIRVTMVVDQNFLIPLPIPGFPNGKPIKGEGTFRCEYS